MAHPLSCLTPEVLLLRSYPLKYKVMETNNLAYQGGKKKKNCLTKVVKKIFLEINTIDRPTRRTISLYNTPTQFS